VTILPTAGPLMGFVASILPLSWSSSVDHDCRGLNVIHVRAVAVVALLASDCLRFMIYRFWAADLPMSPWFSEDVE